MLLNKSDGLVNCVFGAFHRPQQGILAARHEQRLRELVGQRTHALTTACREDHRYHEGGQAL